MRQQTVCFTFLMTSLGFSLRREREREGNAVAQSGGGFGQRAPLPETKLALRV